MSGHDSAGSHSFCGAADDVSDGGKLSVPLPALKYVPTAVIINLPPLGAPPSTRWRAQHLGDVRPSSVALNIRHCIFLI
jgi:hypothetical protein